MGPEDVEKVSDYGKRHSEVCAHLYIIQNENGIYLLHEHPWGASSRKQEYVTELFGLQGVKVIKSHMCAFGNAWQKPPRRGISEDTTGFVTNSVNTCKQTREAVQW